MRAHLTALLFLALAAPGLAAQHLLLAVNDNDTHNYASAIGWPSSTVAMRFSAPATTVLGAAQVFTGNALGTNHLAVWSHDPVNNRPGAPLQPSSSFGMLRQRCFQGTTFAPGIPVTQGLDYWLVWDVVNFAQNSVADPATTPNVDVRVSADGGASWHAAVTWAAQFRLYEPSPTGTLLPYGSAKPGVLGNPTLGISGWPTVGNPLDVWVDDTARRAPAILLAGTPTQQVLPEGTLWVTPAVLGFHQTYFLNFSGVTLVGSLAVTFRVPNLPAAAGFPLSFQWAIFDAAAAGGIAHTAAITAVLQ